MKETIAKKMKKRPERTERKKCSDLEDEQTLSETRSNL